MTQPVNCSARRTRPAPIRPCTRGAVYLHQGETYLVCTFDEEQAVALVKRADVDYFTTARDLTDIAITETTLTSLWGEATMCFGSVDVTTQVVSYLRRRVLTGEVIGEQPLDLPPATTLDPRGLVDSRRCAACRRRLELGAAAWCRARC